MSSFGIFVFWDKRFILQKLLDTYINYSFHVALAILALYEVTVLNFNLPGNIYYVIIVFFGTVTGYNFLKYFTLLRNRYFLKSHKLLISLTLFSALVSLYAFFRLSFGWQTGIFVLGCIVSAYPMLRKNGILKLFLVSLCIALTTVTLPLSEVYINSDILFIESFQRFLWVSALMIPFEIVDMKADNLNLKTIPQRIGIRRTKILGYVMLTLYIVIEIIRDSFDFTDCIINLLLVFSIYFSNENRPSYFTSFWIESLPVVWWILLFAAN